MKIRILGHDIKVIYNSQEYLEGRRGSAHLANNEIKIQNDVAEDRQAQTLLHEILEYINDELGMELEHEKITQLDCGLYQVIADNPDVFTFKLPKK